MKLTRCLIPLIASVLFCGVARADDASKPLIDTTKPLVDKPAATEAPKPMIAWGAPLASPVTKNVKAACEAKDDTDQAFCFGTLVGLYDSNFYVADALEAQPLCIPETTTAEQMRTAFLDMTVKRSDQLEGPISIFYYMAMNAEFPCKTGQTATPKPKK